MEEAVRVKIRSSKFEIRKDGFLNGPSENGTVNQPNKVRASRPKSFEILISNFEFTVA